MQGQITATATPRGVHDRATTLWWFLSRRSRLNLTIRDSFTKSQISKRLLLSLLSTLNAQFLHHLRTTLPRLANLSINGFLLKPALAPLPIQPPPRHTSLLCSQNPNSYIQMIRT